MQSEDRLFLTFSNELTNSRFSIKLELVNRIKAANPEAFHFWHEAHQIVRVFPDGALKQTT